MKNSQFKLLMLLQVAILFLVSISFFYDRSENKSEQIKTGRSLKAASNSMYNEPQREKVFYDNVHIFGDPAAPNELIVFSRFNCRYCKQFYQDQFSYLQNKYVNEGVLKIIFIVTASPMDKTEMLMAKSLEIGREKNLYGKMQKTFYSNEFQNDSVSITNLLLQEDMTSDVLVEKLVSNSVKENIQRQLKEVERLKVTGTPTFFLNGYRMVGYDDKDNFSNYLEAYINY